FLPDKAIDLVDEAASRIKMELDSKPTGLDQLERQILQLEIEQTSLSKEKAAVNAVSVVQSQLEQARTELEQAQRQGDLTKSAEIQYGKIPDLEKKLAAMEKQTASATRTSLLRQEVTAE